MWVYDLDTLKFLRVNDAAVQRYGFSQDEFQSMTIKEIRPAEDVPVLMASLKGARRRGLGIAGISRHRKRDGSVIEVEIASRPLRFRQRRCRLVVVQDVTERRRLEASLLREKALLEQRVARRTTDLRLSERRYRRLVEMSPDAIFVNRNNRVVFMNRAGLELFGARRPEQVLGKSVFKLFHPVNHLLMRQRIRQMLQLKQATPLVELSIIRLDGAVRDVEVAASHCVDQGGPSIQVVLHDITVRKRLEREILLTIEREQERIGRDLHDGLCQVLVAAKYRSAFLEKLLQGRLPAQAREAAALERMLSQAIHQARGLARGLNPVKLVAHGLMFALKQLASGVEEAARVRCFCLFPKPVEVSGHTVANHLYRIAQEAVQNAITHGRARNVSIALVRRGRRVVLTVKDDGVGFPSVLRKRTGMGLDNMRTRAGQIGGVLEIRRRKKGGTAVTCSLISPAEPGCAKRKHGVAKKDNQATTQTPAVSGR